MDTAAAGSDQIRAGSNNTRMPFFLPGGGSRRAGIAMCSHGTHHEEARRARKRRDVRQRISNTAIRLFLSTDSTPSRRRKSSARRTSPGRQRSTISNARKTKGKMVAGIIGVGAAEIAYGEDLANAVLVHGHDLPRAVVGIPGRESRPGLTRLLPG
jgi:hypothetical protein